MPEQVYLCVSPEINKIFGTKFKNVSYELWLKTTLLTLWTQEL